MIKISGLDKYFNKNKSNEIHVIDDLNLKLPDKGLISFFGRSGCGKTTLLNVIGGIDDYDRGSIDINGKNITKRNRDFIRNKNIGYIFQNYCLDVKCTVLENVLNALLIAGLKDAEKNKEKAILALKCVGMDKYINRNVTDLSGGQQQRVAIARAIVKGPNIILADEPTGNLDEENTLLIMEILKELSKEKLVLLVSHEKELVEKYSDKIIQIVDGKIVSQLKNDPKEKFEAGIKKNIYLEDLPKKEIDIDGVKIEYYGDLYNKAASIIIVANNGKLYLKTNDKNVNVVDNTTEVKIFEKHEHEKESVVKMDIQNFEQINSKRNGKLYTFKKSFKDGLNYTFGKKKKGQKKLRWFFALLAIVFVFISAKIGGQYYAQNEMKYTVNDNGVYISFNNGEEKQLIHENLDQTLIVKNQYTNLETFNLKVNGYEEVSIGLNTKGYMLPLSTCKNKKYVKGKEAQSIFDAVISTSLANDILKDNTYSFINDYDSIMGMCITKNSGYHNGINIAEPLGYENSLYYETPLVYKIVGIFESNDKVVCVNDVNLVNTYSVQVLDGRYLNIKPVSYMKNEYKINQGEGIILHNSKDKINYENVYTSDWNKNIFDSYKIVENKTVDEYIEPCLVLNDKDYLKYCVYNTFNTTNVIMLYEDDEAKRIELINSLSTKYPGAKIMDKEEFIDDQKEELNQKNQAYYMMFVLILLLFAIIIFFIMRSNMFNKIHEIGISRAIGVNKSNIVFKFFVESLSLVTTIVFIVHLIFSAIFWKLQTSVATIMTSFYLPIWLYLISIGLLFITISLAAILPVLIALRNTPAQLLSKYDI